MFIKAFALINPFKLFDDLHIRNLLNFGTATSDVIHLLCTKLSFACELLIEPLVSTNITNRTNYKEIPDLFFYEPGGTSIKNILHWLQIYTSQKLAKFDYGKSQNLKIYGNVSPPEYNLNEFNNYEIPSLITRSDSDPFSALADIDLWLSYTKYENKKHIINVLNLNNYNHLDYLWSKDAKEDIYEKITDFIK